VVVNSGEVKMGRTLYRTAVPAIIALGALLTGSAAVVASSGEDEFSLPESSAITLNDGTVIGVGQQTEFTFEADRPVDENGFQAMACPEVNDKPTYTVKGTPDFIPAQPAKSTWLLPNQEVSWTISDTRKFSWDVGIGHEAEADLILAKAKAKIDSKITVAFEWTGSQTVRDTNKGTKGYRAVLGQVGWKLATVKSWVVPPCTTKKETIVIKAPREGDLSIGRQDS
jgi:hypothetical protein